PAHDLRAEDRDLMPRYARRGHILRRQAAQFRSRLVTRSARRQASRDARAAPLRIGQKLRGNPRPHHFQRCRWNPIVPPLLRSAMELRTGDAYNREPRVVETDRLAERGHVAAEL